MSPSVAEGVSNVVGPGIAALAAVHEVNATAWVDAPWVENIPGADHATSMAGSYCIGLAGGYTTEWAANTLSANGAPGLANRVRRLGRAATIASSLACQITIEAFDSRGVADKWDIFAGLAATIPGMLSGHYFARTTDGESA